MCWQYYKIPLRRAHTQAIGIPVIWGKITCNWLSSVGYDIRLLLCLFFVTDLFGLTIINMVYYRLLS